MTVKVLWRASATEPAWAYQRKNQDYFGSYLYIEILSCAFEDNMAYLQCLVSYEFFLFNAMLQYCGNLWWWYLYYSVVWESRNGDTRYMISVCQPLNAISSTSPCGDHQSSVCQVNAEGQSVNIGTFSTSPNVTEIASEGVVELRLQGEACAEQAGKFYTTIINFKCGKTLVRFGIIWSMFYMTVRFGIIWSMFYMMVRFGIIWYMFYMTVRFGIIWYMYVMIAYDEGL